MSGLVSDKQRISKPGMSAFGCCIPTVPTGNNVCTFECATRCVKTDVTRPPEQKIIRMVFTWHSISKRYTHEGWDNYKTLHLASMVVWVDDAS